MVVESDRQKPDALAERKAKRGVPRAIPSAARRWTGPDAGLFLIVVTTATLHALIAVDFPLPPAEDAAILMRYAKHAAAGHGIVWNIGEAPVDGATDFLFMLAVAAIVKCGAGLEAATRALILAAHAATAGLAYLAARQIGGASRPWALATAAYVILGPGTLYLSAYFGAPVFAFAAALAWTCALAIIAGKTSAAWPPLFAFCSLLTGLIRPEGVILSLLMLIAVIVAIGARGAIRAAAWFAAVFATLGLAYFVWRWDYFGQPLPNPFYKKGGGALHWTSLKDSIFNTAKFTLPLAPLYAFALYRTRAWRTAVATAVPIAGFTAAFVLISNEMNFAGRFQYAVLPIALISWPFMFRFPSSKAQISDLSSRTAPGAAERMLRVSAFLAIAFTVACAFYFHVLRSDTPHHHDGRFEVGKLLHEYKDRGFRLATSEAGLLPLYSEWPTLDTWGLNDKRIARAGIVTSDQLAEFDPDLIVFHAYFSPIASGSGGYPGWSDMVRVLHDYAERHDYLLAAAFGATPHDTHYYYVRPEVARETDVVDRIRAVAYIWADSGEIARNYATDSSISGRAAQE